MHRMIILYNLYKNYFYWKDYWSFKLKLWTFFWAAHDDEHEPDPE